MPEQGGFFRGPGDASKTRRFLLPVLVLVGFVALVSGLVLSGAVQGHDPRLGVDQTPTTLATVEILPPE